MIRDIIDKIKDTRLIKEEHIMIIIESAMKNDHMMLSKFYSMMEQSVQITVEELLEKYSKIGDVIIPQIEFVIFKTNSGQAQQLQIYYHYWEVNIYNALVDMVLRGLVTLKSLTNRSGEQSFPLFKVSTEFQYQKVITIPHLNEIRVTMVNLVKLIKESCS